MKKGISLIILVITIIVILIIAGAVILSITRNSPINSANEATFKTSLSEYNSALTLYLTKNYSENSKFNPKSIYATTWDGVSITDGTIKELIPSITIDDAKKYIIQQGKLIYVGNDTNEITWSTSLNAKDPYVKNGLIFWLDGNDFKNSPQTTTWIDRSGNLNSVTASNFSYTETSGSNNNGTVIFDGIDDSIDISAEASSRIISSINLTKSFTYEAMIVRKVTDSSIFGITKYQPHWGYCFQIGNNIANPDGLHLRYQDKNGVWRDYYNDSTIPYNKPTYCAVTFNFDTKKIKLFINDNGREWTFTDESDMTTGDALNFINLGWGNYGNMDRAMMRIYNRALSDAEISQNYNSSK